MPECTGAEAAITIARLVGVYQQLNLSGSIVALVTPMTEAGGVDHAAFGTLVDWQIASGTAGIVVSGTTGEAPLLSVSELRDLVRVAVERAGGQVPVIAGVGTTATAGSIERAQTAFDAGADALLLVTPYYLKTSQNGLVAHYAAIADAVDLPQILYNVPARTGCDLLPATAAEVAERAPVVAVKEAVPDMDRIRDLVTTLSENVTVLSGDDPTCVEAMSCGATGVISVTANVAPKEMALQCRLWGDGHWQEAEALARRLAPLHEALFVEPNPIPAKWALAEMGMIGGALRPPLVPLSAEFHPVVRRAIAELELEGHKQ